MCYEWERVKFTSGFNLYLTFLFYHPSVTFLGGESEISLMLYKQRYLFLIVTLLTMVGFFALSTSPVLAHARVEVGPYVVIVGWANEPVIVGERNALVIEVTEDEQPVVGLEAGLDLTVRYAGRTFIGNLSPTGTPGLYHVEIFPTVRGQYQVHLSGTIEDMAIDEVVEPEEVLSAGALQFPEIQPQPLDLQKKIDDLQSQLQTAYMLAVSGLIVGLLGLGLALFSFFRRSK